MAKGQALISFPLVIGADVWWQEGRPDEGGRVTVVHCDAAGNRRALLPAPWNARTRVHEYGGRSYLPVPAPGGAAPAARLRPARLGRRGSGRRGPGPDVDRVR